MVGCHSGRFGDLAGHDLVSMWARGHDYKTMERSDLVVLK
jgi:hypothetical protein